MEGTMDRSIKHINFNSLAIAGFIAGYLMYFVDQKFGGLLGLFGMFSEIDTWRWMIMHHVDAIIFGLLFAWPPVYNKLPGPKWVKGLIYGFLFWLVFLFILGMIAGALGATTFQQMAPSSASGVITFILLHLVYGFFLGVLYNPPEEAVTG